MIRTKERGRTRRIRDRFQPVFDDSSWQEQIDSAFRRRGEILPLISGRSAVTTVREETAVIADAVSLVRP